MTWSSPDVRRGPGTRVLAVLPAARAVRVRRDDIVAAVMTAAVTVLLGAPVGLLWTALAPHSHVSVEAGGAFISDAETEVFIAGDGWFLIITLLVGVLTGALAWLVARRSGPFVVVALFVGGLAAAYVASKVGVRVGQDMLETVVHSGRLGTYRSNVALQAIAAIVAWPLGAVASFALLVATRVDELD